MYLYRFRASDGTAHLGIEDKDSGACFDATLLRPAHFRSVSAWLEQPDPIGAAQEVLRAAREQSAPSLSSGSLTLLPPIDDTQEVWAAGVTYERSRTARMEESEAAGTSDVYDRVYRAERPELFFKANGWRAAGPGGLVRVRRDSAWNVPEPEMTLVIAASGRIVGVTVGNDVSSRDIEGENPLYLPQAKVYDGACALGPRIRLLRDGEWNLADRSIALRIERSSATVFSGETSTARMQRTPEYLAGWLTRELRFPAGAFLMTGTGIVPPDGFTLAPGDVVSITIDGIGTLENQVGD